MKSHLICLCIFFVSLFSCKVDGKKLAEKPNILWLVVEDMSPLLSFYGNNYTHTPALNKFSSQSIVFTNAFSNGAQCSPARSTLISGLYAPSLATDFHRERRSVPNHFFFPKYLQEAGYYCSNNRKTDYNAKNYPKDIWNSSNETATYLNRVDKSKPFFSVFNYNGTHTKRVATRDTLNRKIRNVNPLEVELPPYLPDEPEIRDDIAWHYDAIGLMDNWIKEKLDELEQSGEADNTIVFFYSDHGGCLPRGKAFLYDTGTRIPLMVRFPKKYQYLAKTTSENINNNLVGFVDFAPTLFNLAEMAIPEFMVGQPFLGEIVPRPKPYVFLYRANQEQNFIPSRGLTDGRFKLIWNFNSAYPNGVRQSYQWQMPSYQAWDKAHTEERVNVLQKKFWKPMPPLEFYDTVTDVYEVNNLIHDPKYQEKIAEMKSRLLSIMKEHKDLGLYPWSMRRKKDSIPFYNYVRNTNQPINTLIDVASVCSTATENDIELLTDYLKDPQPKIRYWSSIGVLRLLERNNISEIPKEVTANFNNTNENMEVRLLSAEILVKHHNDKQALNFILNSVKSNYFTAYATLQNLGKLAKPIEQELVKLLDNKKLKLFYIKSALINTGHLKYEDLWL